MSTPYAVYYITGHSVEHAHGLAVAAYKGEAMDERYIHLNILEAWEHAEDINRTDAKRRWRGYVVVVDRDHGTVWKVASGALAAMAIAMIALWVLTPII